MIRPWLPALCMLVSLAAQAQQLLPLSAAEAQDWLKAMKGYQVRHDARFEAGFRDHTVYHLEVDPGPGEKPVSRPVRGEALKRYLKREYEESRKPTAWQPTCELKPDAKSGTVVETCTYASRESASPLYSFKLIAKDSQGIHIREA